jgi:hypothetical protein
MTTNRLRWVCFVWLLCFAGCAASRSQITHCVQQPLAVPGGLGRVAVFSLVSAKVDRDRHAKDAATVRDALRASLENHDGTRVVLSEAVPPFAAAKNSPDRVADALQFARGKVQPAGVDAICLVHLKDGGGYLTLGLPQLASLWGECEYDLRLVDARTGQQLAAASGKWSDRVDYPKIPRIPSAAGLGEEIARVFQPAAVQETAGGPGPAVAATAQHGPNQSRNF